MEQRGALFTAILCRAAGEDIPELDPITNMAFSFISSQLDRDFAKWEDTRAKRVAAGREGGKASGKTRKQKQANEANASISKQNEANEAVNVDVNVDGNVDSVCIGQPSAAARTRSSFQPPTLDEVVDYCRERNNGIDAQRFLDYYTANGWMVGKAKMKDWRAAVRNWERQEEPSPDKPRMKFLN